MKSTPFVLLFVLSWAMASPAFAQQTEATDTNWVVVRPEGVKATLKMPVAPRLIQRTMTPTEDTKITQYQLIASVNDARTAYFFNHHELPEKPVGNAKIRKILDDTHRTMVGRLGGTSIAHTAISLARNPGREIEFHFGKEDKKLVYHARFYLRESKMYQMVIVSEQDAFSEEDAQKFFESLSLTQKPNPPVNEDASTTKTDQN